MQARIAFKLRERGEPLVVSREEWARLEVSGEAQELARLGVLQYRRSGECVIIDPRTLVGRFLSPVAEIEVESKRPDLLAILLRASGRWRKHASRLDPEIRGKKHADSTLSQKYRALLLNLCSEGAPWHYERREQSTSTPQGRVLFQRSISQLLSKGITHKAVISRQTKHFENHLPSALRTVFRAIEAVEQVNPRERSEIFRLVDLLGSIGVLVPVREARSYLEQLRTAHPERVALSAVIDFSLEVLSEPRTFQVSTKVGTGVAEFVDMERLWEDAVALLVDYQKLAEEDRVVQHPLRPTAVTLMVDGGPKLDPDLVAFRGTSPFIVVDAKYSIATSATANDVYQIASYVQRLNASLGVLAYVAPGDTTKVETIGTLAGGARVVMWSLGADAFNAPRGAVRSRLFVSQEQ